MQTHQNGSKIRPHAALHVSLFPGYQSAGQEPPPAHPAVQSGAVLMVWR